MSDFKFPCPKCGQSIVCDTSNAGMNIPCPVCKTNLTVPTAPAAAPVAAAPTKLGVRKVEHSPAPAATTSQPQVTSWANRPGTGATAAPIKKSNKSLINAIINIVVIAVIGAGVWFGWAGPMLKEKAAKEQADKAEAERIVEDKKKADAAAEAERRARAVWTLDLATAKVVEKPASGKIHGVNFSVESKLIQKGQLVLRQDNGSMRLFAFTIPMKPGEGLMGKSVVITSDETNHLPQVVMSWKDDGSKTPGIVTFKKGYAMKLEFGQPADGKLPGKIFLAVPDAEQSFVSGTFEIVVAAASAGSPATIPADTAKQIRTHKKPQ